jgi:dTMP kinase
MAGLFITLEGPEGAGKSTLIPKLVEFIQATGREVISTREPGATGLGKEIRRLLLEGENLSGTTELFLFLADRSHHVSTLIRPALERGAVVLCDRFIDSTVVYQSSGRGLPIVEVDALNRIATGGLQPQLTLLLSVPPAVGLARATKGDRLDREPLAFHEAVAAGYLSLAEAEPERIRVVDANRPVAEVFADCCEILTAFIGQTA